MCSTHTRLSFRTLGRPVQAPFGLVYGDHGTSVAVCIYEYMSRYRCKYDSVCALHYVIIYTK